MQHRCITELMNVGSWRHGEGTRGGQLFPRPCRHVKTPHHPERDWSCSYIRRWWVESWPGRTWRWLSLWGSALDEWAGCNLSSWTESQSDEPRHRFPDLTHAHTTLHSSLLTPFDVVYLLIYRYKLVWQLWWHAGRGLGWCWEQSCLPVRAYEAIPCR